MKLIKRNALTYDEVREGMKILVKMLKIKDTKVKHFKWIKIRFARNQENKVKKMGCVNPISAKSKCLITIVPKCKKKNEKFDEMQATLKK